MKLQAFTLVLMGLTLASCGEDTGSRGKGSRTGSTTPAVETNTTTLVSGVARERGTPQIRYISEAATTSALYHFVPDMSTDVESGRTLTRTSLGRPNLICGTGSGFTSISERIADCEQKNKLLASWNAQNNGTSAEADWSLVAFTSTGKEIWQDQRTKAIWSPIVGVGNWCQASGNEQLPAGNISVNCVTSIPTTETASFCFNLEVEELTGAIQWRLPTRVDYLQAEVDGIRSVISSTDVDASGFWTATMDSTSTDRTKAWIYEQKQGSVSTATLLTNHQVRCIGTTK